MKLYKTNMKKVLGETQTLRAGRSKVEPKKFRLAADPFSGGAGRPKFNQLEMVTTFTYKPSLVRIDARNFELFGNRPTHKNNARPPVANTQTGPITIHCAAKLCAQCKYKYSKILRNRIWISIIKYHYSESY